MSPCFALLVYIDAYVYSTDVYGVLRVLHILWDAAVIAIVRVAYCMLHLCTCTWKHS